MQAQYVHRCIDCEIVSSLNHCSSPRLTRFAYMTCDNALSETSQYLDWIYDDSKYEPHPISGRVGTVQKGLSVSVSNAVLKSWHMQVEESGCTLDQHSHLVCAMQLWLRGECRVSRDRDRQSWGKIHTLWYTLHTNLYICVGSPVMRAPRSLFGLVTQFRMASSGHEFTYLRS